ncbi:hypothetical protein BDY17DRAFT_100851 [Neohortaea acidophila]|uniref:Basic proline-rich protein n=1 Tax=Neohortaea acidophila TaxID=245834 RepID=A0A6A6Q005_9PEZI|nr:uncharacterized protein BDY17DRAFT_100851 [Neohortaea acidophila]KAF2485319.1 hypothetical protein BDY17DRAFT_100851 [Neohortaea acidophila]
MRTSAAAWMAALAVISMNGPFTTAQAAPARPLDADAPRPVYHRLQDGQGFNDTDPTEDTLHHDLLRPRQPEPGLISLLTGALTLPTATTSPRRKAKHHHEPVSPTLLHSGIDIGASSFPLASSSSFPTSAAPNIIVGLTTILHPSAPTSTPDSSDSGSQSSSGTSDSGLLSIIGGGLSGVLPSATQAVGSELSRLTGTGGALHHLTKSALSDVAGSGGILPHVKSDITHMVPTGTANPIGSFLSQVTATGAVPSLLSPVQSQLSGITASGISGVGTGFPFTGIFPTLTSDAGSILSPVQSAVSSLANVTTGLPALQSSLSSFLSGVGSGVSNATSLIGTLTTPLSIPPGVIPSGVIPSGVIPTGVIPTGVTITAGDSTVTIPLPGTGIPTGLTSTLLPPVLTLPTVTTGVTSPSDTTGVTSPTDTTGVTSPTDTTGVTSATSNTSTSQDPTITPTGTIPITNATTPVSIVTDTTAVPSTSASTTLMSSITTPTTISTGTRNGPLVSISPTGTDTQSSLSLPTVWTFAPSSTTTSSAGIQTATSTTLSSSTGLATSLPQLVQPAGGSPNPGSNFTLIQVGFEFALNYPFVVSRPESASQIFAYLPQGIAHGLGINESSVMMNALQPYNTAAKLGFVTTLAQAYIPSGLVDQLQLDIRTATSQLYYNDHVPVQQLMRVINPAIPILPGSTLDGVPEVPTFNAEAAAGAGKNTGAGAPIGGDSGVSKSVRGTSVGIGAGAVAGAAVYAAAMIYVARRYRQKRKNHRRASSIPAAVHPGEMTQRSSAGGMGSLFMSGAIHNARGTTARTSLNSAGRNSRTSNTSSNGRSVREQGISAPLMSENSLGWN